jgi:hypothetical protein
MCISDNHPSQLTLAVWIAWGHSLRFKYSPTKDKLVGVILGIRVSRIISGPDEWAHFE